MRIMNVRDWCITTPNKMRTKKLCRTQSMFPIMCTNNSQSRQARSFILLIHVIYWRSFAANACFNKRWHDYRTLLCLSLAFAFVCVLDIESTVSLSLSLARLVHIVYAWMRFFFQSAPHCSILAILLIFIWFELSTSTRHIPIRRGRLFMVTTTTSASSVQLLHIACIENPMFWIALAWFIPIWFV